MSTGNLRAKGGRCRPGRRLETLGAELRERGIGLHVIEQGIDTAAMESRALFGMLSVLAELQRELIAANTNDGLASARARGRGTGLTGTAKLPGGAATLLARLGHVGVLVREDVTAGMPDEEERTALQTTPDEPTLRITEFSLLSARWPESHR